MSSQHFGGWKYFFLSAHDVFRHISKPCTNTLSGWNRTRPDSQILPLYERSSFRIHVIMWICLGSYIYVLFIDIEKNNHSDLMQKHWSTKKNSSPCTRPLSFVASPRLCTRGYINQVSLPISLWPTYCDCETKTNPKYKYKIAIYNL